MLPRRGPEAFEKFMAALKSCEQQQFVAEELARTLVGTDSMDAVSKVPSSKSDAQIIQEVTGCISVPCLALLKF